MKLIVANGAAAAHSAMDPATTLGHWRVDACLLRVRVLVDAWNFQRAERRQFEGLLVDRIALPAATKLSPLAAPGGLIGLIDIPRLGLSVIVIEGTGSATLRRAAGHIPGTALPGQSGNVGISGHRDTFFRPLRNIRRNDIITLTTLLGEYRYRVVSTKIVSPSDVAVLDPGGSELSHPGHLLSVLLRGRSPRPVYRSGRKNCMRETSKIRKIAFVADHLPRKCGIATFTTDLLAAVANAYPQSECLAVSVNDIPGGYEYPEVVRFEIEEQDLSSYLRAADFLNISNVDIVCLQHEFGIFGGPVGGHILAFLRELRMPVVTTLHTFCASRKRTSGA